MKKYFLVLLLMIFSACSLSFFARKQQPQQQQKAISERPLPIKIAAVGDVACQPEWKTTGKECQQGAVANLVADDSEIASVLILGDAQYGTSITTPMAGFDQSFGRFKDKIYPALGNHDYSDSGLSTYFDYFDSIEKMPYYSFDLGGWHLVALNTVCEESGCGLNSPQLTWLEKDLTDHAKLCTLAFGHHPRYSSGSTHGSQTVIKSIWETLVKHKVDISLAGHEHNYERIGIVDGVREFVVGTGGRNLYPFGPPLPKSEFRDEKDFGVLVLTLFPDKYEWKFINIQRETIDSGSNRCL